MATNEKRNSPDGMNTDTHNDGAQLWRQEMNSTLISRDVPMQRNNRISTSRFSLSGT
jgi:hypothetical protein